MSYQVLYSCKIFFGLFSKLNIYIGKSVTHKRTVALLIRLLIRITPKLQFTDSRYFLNFFTLKISCADENDFEKWIDYKNWQRYWNILIMLILLIKPLFVCV